MKLSNYIRLGVVALGFACLAGGPFCFTASAVASEESLEDLGDQLLNDALLERLIDAANKAEVDDSDSAAGNAKPADAPPGLLPNIDELRRMLEPPQPKQPEHGEDLGESPLASILDRMTEARQLIESQSLSSETKPVQEEIIVELDKLIDKLNKQCQNCSKCQQNKSSSQQTQSSTPKPGAGKPSSSADAQSQPQQSQASMGGGAQAMPSEPTERDVAKQLWGQLPERLRQQLLQSTAEEFLPKYREELELYFQRLAEEQSEE